MINAYDEIYLEEAMQNLGEAFDYASNIMNISPDYFLDSFIISGIAEQFGKGVPKYVSGMSGTELVQETLRKTGCKCSFPEPTTDYDCSPEYWCGWILAYYQWHTGKRFKEIKAFLPMTEIIKLYPTLHEASEDKFIDVANAILKRKNLSTNLQTIRKAVGISQKQLSEKSGVTLRMIQQYEQRSKDINKATATNLFALSNALGCRAEEIME